MTQHDIKAKVQRSSKSTQTQQQMVGSSPVPRDIKPLTDLSVSAMLSKPTQARQNMVGLNDGQNGHFSADWPGAWLIQV